LWLSDRDARAPGDNPGARFIAVITSALRIDLLRVQNDGGRGSFVHFTGINGDGYRSLPEGSKVSYE
jgi:hypothetical protein